MYANCCLNPNLRKTISWESFRLDFHNDALMARSLQVAVIGGGVGGLITARELQRQGHRVVVYEKSDRIGGIWVYNPQVEDDPLGLDPQKKAVHSSLYASLRTNLPRKVMGFSDYPFTIRDKNGELREFPGHEEVLKFLNNFARDFGLIELIRFNTEVVRVEQKIPNEQWVVESRASGHHLIVEELFEAVVVCNGHYTRPKLADLPGIKKWPGKQIHCHNYRTPEPFVEQVVVVIGAGPSAQDISQETSKVAKEVHLSSRLPTVLVKKLDAYDNVWQHSKIEYCYKNGEIAFEDGATVAADIIVHCTGYKYDFPFLQTNGIITVDDNRVGPLYKHIFPPQLAPSLSFVGMPNRAINFLMMELQAKWVASVLSGKAILPSKEVMLADVEEHYRLMEETGVPKHHTHRLPMNQFEYLDWLAVQAGLPPVDEEIKQTFEEFINVYRSSWVKYRENYVRIKMNAIN